MKKMKAILVIAAIMTALTLPLVTADTTITGTFTPQGTVAIHCNVSAPAFSNIDLDANATVSMINITNFGDTDCTVVTTAVGVGDWSLVAGTDNPTGSNQYCVNMYNRSGYGSGWYDIQAEKSITKCLNATGVNYTHFDLKVYCGTNTDEGTPSQQTFYTNLTAAAIS